MTNFIRFIYFGFPLFASLLWWCQILRKNLSFCPYFNENSFLHKCNFEDMLFLSNIFCKIFSFAVDASFTRYRCLSIIHCTTIDLAFACFNIKLLLYLSLANDGISTHSISSLCLSVNKHLTRNFQLLKFSTYNWGKYCAESMFSFEILFLKLWSFIFLLYVIILPIFR